MIKDNDIVSACETREALHMMKTNDNTDVERMWNPWGVAHDGDERQYRCWAHV